MTALEDLAERSEAGFPNLTRGTGRDPRRASPPSPGRLDGLDVDADAAVVLFGSWGRGEVTEQSDYDWAVLVDGPDPRGGRARPRGGRGGALDRRPRPGDRGDLRRRRLLRPPGRADRPRRRRQHQPLAPHAAPAGVDRDRPPGGPRQLPRPRPARLPRRVGRRLPPAALLPQRPDPLLAHDLRRLRRQRTARGRGPQVGDPRPEAAHLAEDPLRRRPAADPPLPPPPRRRDGGLPARVPGPALARPHRLRLPRARRGRRRGPRGRRLRPLPRR